MKIKLSPLERDVAVLHLFFTFICVVVLAVPLGFAPGLKMFGLVVFYNLMMPLSGLCYPAEELLHIWFFVIIISIFQVMPDWFLSAQLGILIFPEDGFVKIGEVSAYMAGLWAIPLFVIIFIGRSVQKRFSLRAALWSVVVSSLVIFAGSEETMWMIPSWQAVNVTTLGHVAVYLLIPEIILGLSAFLGYEAIKGKKHWFKIPAAFLIMLLYIGSLSFFYFLLETLILS
jgi:hypothetical protein